MFGEFMEKIIVNGGRKLSGKIAVESAKNAVLPMMAGAILTDEEVIIEDCPKIKDVFSMIDILKSLGVKVRFDESNLIINSKDVVCCKVCEEHAKKLRSSVFMLGALLSRFNRAEICFPGGCNIGERAIDLHVDGLNTLGVKTEFYSDCFVSSAEVIKGKKINLKYPSVGATENLILASIFAKGETVLVNCAKEPEVENLITFLNAMGAKIYGAGKATVIIEGVNKLHGCKFKPIGDRIEGGTYLLATAVTGGEIEISNINAENITCLLNKLCNNTCKFKRNNGIIYYKSRGIISSQEISTGPHPDFPTDLQAPMMAYLSIASGKSMVTENVFERRFEHVIDLNNMGANISVEGRTALINGVDKLHGANLFAKDLRGGAGLLIASLVAEGISTIYGLEHIDRGYARIEEKMSALGADVKRL